MPDLNHPAVLELDRLICEKVMGWHLQKDTSLGFDMWEWHSPNGKHGYSISFSPSKEVEHAFRIARDLSIPDHEFTLIKGPKVWECGWRHYRQPAGGDWECAIGDTIPLAICRAALAAVGHE